MAVLDDIPNWMSAFGSVFALGFGAVAVVVTRRMYQIESERDQVNEGQQDCPEATLWSRDVAELKDVIGTTTAPGYASWRPFHGSVTKPGCRS
jgi:hypothetical protein